MVIPKINSAHGSDTRNIINAAIDSINAQGKSIQNLVAEGQLTPEQYATLIQTVNGLISKGNVSPNDLAPELLSLINNSEGIPLNVLSIPRNHSVDHEKTTFIQRGKNIFDKSQAHLNKTIQGGNLIDSSTSFASEMIFVESGKTYIANANINIDYFGQDKSYIKYQGVPSGNPFTIPSNVMYMRFGCYTQYLNTLQVEAGSNRTEYEAYSETLLGVEVSEDNLKPDLKSRVQFIPTLDQSQILQSMNLIKPKNMIDTEQIVDKRGLSAGEVVINENQATSGFIRVTGDVPLIANQTVTMAEYDVDRNLIKQSGIPGKTAYTTSRNTAYVRVAFNRIYRERLQLEEGTSTTTYESYFEPYLDLGGSSAPLAGERILFIGDSNTHTSSYPSIIGRETGAETFNGGFGGTRLIDVSESSAGYYHEINGCAIADAIATEDFSSLITLTELIDAETTNSNEKYRDQLQNIIDACTNIEDLSSIVITYGTNDVSTSNDILGTPEEINTKTWNGAINYFVKRISEAHPHIKIYFTSPVFRARMPSSNVDGEYQNSDDWGRGVMLPDMVEALRERTKVHHIPFIDLYNTSGINRYTHTHYLSDGTHYNIRGNDRVAHIIAGALSNN